MHKAELFSWTCKYFLMDLDQANLQEEWAKKEKINCKTS